MDSIIEMFLGIVFFSIMFVFASCQDYDNINNYNNLHSSNRLLANLRRRDSIPLHEINRQWDKGDENNFRKIRHIASIPSRKYDVSLFL